MFPTDINMRDSDTKKGELEERKRHNKRAEQLEERAQNLDIAGKVVSGVLQAGGRTAAGIAGAAARNHPEWYLKDPILADQNTQISTQIPVGYNQAVFQFADENMSDKTCSFVSYWYAPLSCMYYGDYTDDPAVASTYVGSSPMNYVNKALYAWIKNKCRRNLNYTPADIIRTMLAVMDVYCDLESVKRIYRLANTYAYINRTLSASIIKSLGINPDTVYPNLATILYRVNRIGKLISTVKIPVGQTVFDRWMYLASHIFKDTDDVKTRLFAFTKAVSYKLVFGDKVGNFNRALLAERPFNSGTYGRDAYDPTSSKSILEYITAIETRATALLSNSEILAAMADMLTAFEANGFLTFQPLNSDDVQDIIYDINAIYQVKNATLTGFPQVSAQKAIETTLLPECFDMYDLNDGILAQGRVYNRGDSRYTIGPTTFNAYDGYKTITGARTTTRGIINGSVTPRVGIESYSDHPDAGELLTVTRLSVGLSTTVLSSNSSDAVTICSRLVTHGTEIIMCAMLVTFNNRPEIQAYNTEIIRCNNLSSDTTSKGGIKAYLPLQAFNAKPRLPWSQYTITGNANGDTLTIHIATGDDATWIVGTFNKIIYIDNTMLERWHFVAVASEFAMPNVLE